MDGDGWHQLMGGGSQVTTIEYGIIQSLHPQVHTLTPRQVPPATPDELSHTAFVSRLFAAQR
eukprot:3122922-Rhodomonas_salina.1